jgi:hypothetical protein
MRCYVFASRAVTALAARLRWVITGNQNRSLMRILVEVKRNVSVAGFARITADELVRRGLRLRRECGETADNDASDNRASDTQLAASVGVFANAGRYAFVKTLQTASGCCGDLFDAAARFVPKAA